jgi:Xaa-Pro aminopeptidase
VTRTLPVSGRFTQEQRKVYDVVLKAQEAAIAVIHPGVPFSEIDKTARKVITEAGYGPYFIHGTSHFIGLDVHDAGDTSATLEAGMVLTVEPGIYIPDKNLGIRIEDDVLVTREGSRVLSDCAPRKPDAVEMQRAEGLKSAER